MSDTSPAQGNGTEFETALRLFESEAAGFAQSVIRDPAARAEYMRKTKAASDELVDLVKQRRITPHEAARTANAMRNESLELARAKLTDFGLAISREMKQNGPPLNAFEEKYALKKFGKPFGELAQAEREAVWVEIVHAAGRSRRSVNIRVRWYGVAAGAVTVALVSNPAGWVVGAVMFVGAALAGVGSSEVFDYFWPER